jgi:outer membrane lipoprotein carrier protein
VRRFLHVAFAVAVVAAAVPTRAAVSAPDVGEVVRKLQSRYESTADFTADFAQQVEVKTLDQKLESRGKVYFKRPGRMRWEYLQPERQTIVADGTTLWIHQPDHNQVLKAPFRLAFRSSMPVSFLFGMGELTRDFAASIDAADGATVRLRLEPKEAESEIGLLVLTVDAATYDIRAADVTDPLGNVTRLEFSNIRRGVGLGDAEFVFRVPDGADVVEAPPSP